MQNTKGFLLLVIVFFGIFIAYQGCSDESKDEYYERVLQEQLDAIKKEGNTPSTPLSQEERERMQQDNAAKVEAIRMRNSDACNDVEAATAAEQYMLKQLRSPKSAEFASFNPDNVKYVPDTVTYVSYVDSQNGFGATLRTYFKVWMLCGSGGLKVLDVKMEQQ